MRGIKSLSDKELLINLKKLVSQEQDLLIKILPHLIEFKRRKLYRDLGYRSLYEYCTQERKYSESAAMRRIHAARAIDDCPPALEYLKDHRVTLSTLSLVWKHVSPDLLDKISNKSKREVDAIFAELKPELYIKDQSKPVVVERLVLHTPTTNHKDSECKEIYRRSGGKLFASVENSTPQANTKLVRQKVKMHEVRCLIDDDVMRQVERCKQLLSNKYPKGLTYSELLKELTASWLEQNDPLSREKRREARKQRATRKQRAVKRDEEQGRHIPLAIKDAVFKRDGGRCTFVGSNGRRCESKFLLQFDHYPIPYARGGPSTVNNLRLLCAEHNRHTAEQVYGKTTIKKHYIKEAPGRYHSGFQTSSRVASRMIC